MTAGWRILMIAVAAFVAAFAGVFVGRVLIPAAPPQTSQLHDLLHHRLGLDTAQQAKLEVLEQRFAVRRKALEAELRAENARLADAIQAEHGNGPKVAAAVDASHRTMGALQKETLAHIFAMRQLLKPAQAAQFDKVVVKALTADSR
jgi:nickel and cobalt resistance protein CnrR